MHDDLKKIKKYYGERMMHLCRELFPTILDKNGQLFSLLSNNFNYTHFLYDDIINTDSKKEFQNYIYSLFNSDNNLKESDGDPYVLMNRAGYRLFECFNDKEVDIFKKYYADGEVLCTFKGGRCETHHVFFAVRKDVQNIKRGDYTEPKREDKYGRSVISIQFTKGKSNILSIKNRYNHHVELPDATYNNNLDNIIPGLTDSFTKRFGLNIIYNKENFFLNNYVQGPDGKFYRFNYEINNIYYCSDNIIICNNEVKKYEKEKYIIIDYFIVDLVNKKISLFDKKISDGFVRDETFKKIEIFKTDTGKIVKLYGNNNTIIELDKYNRIIKYQSDEKEIANNFLVKNTTLEEFIDENLEEVGDNFLLFNNNLHSLYTPNLKKTGDYFLELNSKIKTINFPKLVRVGSFFMRNSIVKKACFPALESVGAGFMQINKELDIISFPSLLISGIYFLCDCTNVREVYCPNLEIAEHDFMARCKNIKSINFPKLQIVKSNFYSDNTIINEVYLPSVVYIEDNFMIYNMVLKRISLPNVLRIGEAFLFHNTCLEEIYAPNLYKIESYFLELNTELKEINFPKLEEVGRNFLYSNADIERIITPKLSESQANFCISVKNLKEYDLRSLKKSSYSPLQPFMGGKGYNSSIKKLIKNSFNSRL